MKIMYKIVFKTRTGFVSIVVYLYSVALQLCDLRRIVYFATKIPFRKSSKENYLVALISEITLTFLNFFKNDKVGCVMIAPPVYLSEADAMKIIFEELKKEGLTFEDKYKGDSLSIEFKKLVFSEDTTIRNYVDRFSHTTKKRNLYPDAYNEKLNLLIQYVSFEDYEKYGDQEIPWSSVYTFEIKKAAQKIRKAYLEEAQHGAVVFYDPVGRTERKYRGNWKKMEKSGRENAVKMLKLQVADFIEWLKKEYRIEKK